MQAGRTLLQSILWRGLYYVGAFVINILIARHFQASVSGAVYYLSSIYALVLLFSSLSLESGIIFFVAKDKIAAGKLFGFSLVWSLVIGLTTFVFVFLFRDDAYQGISRNLLIVSSVSFVFGNLLTTYCSSLFYAKNNFIVPNCINIIITICLVVVLPFNGRSVIPAINDENYFYIYFSSFFVQGICVAIAAKLKYVKSSLFDLINAEEFRILFWYCFMAFVSNIITFLLYRIDYFFVERYCTTAQLGNYIQVSKLGHLFFILPTILASAVFPITASGQPTSIIKILTMLSRLIFSFYVLACLVLVLVGKWLFPLVFGESFADMYQPFIYLIPGILALSGIFTITAYFAGKNRIRFNIIGSLLALIVIFIGDVIFIPIYGINAAAWVSSLGYIAYQVYVLVIINKEFKTTVSDFFVFRIADLQQVRNYINDKASS
ncbi:MAG TPA: polysaccharide biosynthesis C-terminal domain-containing protein [Ferruginibacter sp.]|jgi:O-antigen/teichoic acid export membrane protein|nr:polysaccharide biosynthesis C-terminal domain-containing protein [Ferruginibacter sp.]